MDTGFSSSGIFWWVIVISQETRESLHYYSLGSGDLACPLMHAHRFAVYCSLPRLLCPGVLIQLSSWGQIIQRLMHHPGRATGAAAVGMWEVCQELLTELFTYPLFALWVTCQIQHSTSHKAPWCSLSCPFSHSMPCTMWLLKIVSTYKQQVRPFQSLPPAGDGVDKAWWYSLVWEDSLCACPHLSKICTGTQIWKSHPQRTYLWPD